jgi:hypothetical protein
MLPCPAPSPRARWALLPALIVALCLFLGTGARAQYPEAAREYRKKAEFIMCFTHFIEWPARKFPQPDSPFIIAVFGVDNISAQLEAAIQDRQIKGRPVVVKHLLNKAELRGCHMLFISRSERDRLGPILGEVRRENVLTIGECDTFLGKSGIINFVNRDGAIRFQISTEAAAREKFSVSSKLLQLAVPAGPDMARLRRP